MNPTLAKKLLADTNSDKFSVIYPRIRDEIKEMHLQFMDLPFPEEFLFFEDDYLTYYLDINKRGIPSRKIVDIGCAYGFQSYIFEDYDYTGIEFYKMKFFRDKGNYTVGCFPTNVNIDLTDSIVISNMSLGYSSVVRTEQIVNALKDCRWLYISSTDEVIEALAPYFPHREILSGEFTYRRFFSKEAA